MGATCLSYGWQAQSSAPEGRHVSCPWHMPLLTELRFSYSLNLQTCRVHGAQCFRTQHQTVAALRFVHDHLCRWLAHLELGAHFLDLRGLLFELCSESFYLFLLLRDGCLQRLSFAIENRVGFAALG